MQLVLRDNLPFVTVTLAYQGAQVTIANVLVDTGSARTIFAADVVANIHITPIRKEKSLSIAFSLANTK